MSWARLFCFKFFKSGWVMIEIRIRTRCASSYDNYLSPSMIGGLVVLRRMKYLAFKRVLLPSILANRRIGKKKRIEKVFHTCPGKEGILYWPPLKPRAKTTCFTLKIRSLPFCCLTTTDHSLVIGSWVELMTSDEVQTFNSITST